MKCEIITIGDEILLGKTLDTNSSWIAQELMKMGVQVYYKSTILPNLKLHFPIYD